MFGSSTLEVAIGVVFVYFITSLLCSTVTEWISRVFAMRSRTLKDGIKQLLNNQDELKNRIYNHPLVKGMSSKDKWWIFPKKEYGPSEIPPRTFSLALIDLISGVGLNTNSAIKGKQIPPGDASQKMIDSLEQNIESFNADDSTKQVLRTLLNSAKTTVSKVVDPMGEFRTLIEKWFDDSMQRVTGWYKRKTQLIVLALALIICFSINVDTFGIANSLFKDAALRASLVAAAETQVASANASDLQNSAEISKLGLPIGWAADPKTPNSPPNTAGEWFIKIFGIVISAFAVSLGATFWFDMLSKLVNLRAAGKKPATTEETGTAVGTG